MVYTGKPSAGCENCRRAKKLCDQGNPCSRCARLGQECGGYRDMSDLIFRDETENTARRVTSQPDTGRSTSSSSRQLSPDIEIVATRFFFDQFVDGGQLSFLEGVSPDEFLLKPIMACALLAMATRENSDRRREQSRRYYVEAITATNAALRHRRRVKEDNTLISVCLLSLFERLSWENGGSSRNAWKDHVQGSAQVLQIRGREQINTDTGALLFRELRTTIVVNALMSEVEAPEYIVEWTYSLRPDRMYAPADQLTILASRAATIRAAFRTSSKSDAELLDLSNNLENDLIGWEESNLRPGSPCSYRSVRDSPSPYSWNGVRHEYIIPHTYRHWNLWRCLRIMLNRIQEAVWRRSWPILARPSRPVPNAEYYRSLRTRMATGICGAAACTLGNSSTLEPPKGAISCGLLMVLPLLLAGTCLLEELKNPTVSPGGSRMILLDEPFHGNLFDEASNQLTWIIARLDYIADNVGVRWAAVISKVLKGDCKVFYDLARSRVVKNEDPVSQIPGDVIDTSHIVQLSVTER